LSANSVEHSAYADVTKGKPTVPTYQYACTACEHRFEIVQAFSDSSLTTCPECEGKLRKLFGSVGIVFKGSGFYRTDSRSNGSPGTESSSNGSQSGTSESSKGAKSDSGAGSGSSGGESSAASSTSSSSATKKAS
jgi:putative FmdB family regulatory protein